MKISTKNILLIIPYGGVGGIERLAMTFYNQYKSDGFEVKIIKIIKLPTDLMNFGIDEIGLSEIDLHSMSLLKRIWFYSTIPFSIRQFIRKNEITHSISFGDLSNFFSSLTYTDEYKIGSIHALKSAEFAKKNMLNSIFKFSYRYSYNNFKKVVCISNAIKKDLILSCNFKFLDKLTVIYNPHDVPNIDYLSDLPILNEDEIELFKNRVLLFIGRISIQKAPWHLLKAFSLIAKPNIKLVFIGDGSAEIKHFLNEILIELNISESVVFLGRKENPYNYLKLAEILVLSSYYEGTPNVIVESIVCAVPIVTSNCTDGIMELMTVEQPVKIGNLIKTESGIITPTFFEGILEIPSDKAITTNEKEFAKALNLILDDKRYKENLVLNRNQLLSKFNLKSISKNYLKQN